MKQETLQEYDVVICGGGLAGLTLARQLTRELPDLSLAMLDQQAGESPVAAYKVGEATTEMSAHYLSHILGLRDYLESSQIRKMGLRFFFHSPEAEFHTRPELGASQFDPVHSYQLDRGVLENDLRRFNRKQGIAVISDTKVNDIILGEGSALHEIRFTKRSTNSAGSVRSRWVVDAMGRRRFLQKKLGLAGKQSTDCSASWFRLEGRISVCDLVPRTIKPWHDRVPGDYRYNSTNHLMGDGRWVWVIPLVSGCTSIGIVTREDVIPFSLYNTYERAMAWLEQNEKALFNLIVGRPPLDFKCMRHYSYSSTQVFSENRWVCSGESGVFADPLFSFGIDQIGFGNTVITEMIKRERKGELTPQVVDHYNNTYLSFNIASTWLAQVDMPFFGHPMVMGAKFIWDMIRGWAVTAPQRFNKIYLEPERSAAISAITSRLSPLFVRMEKLFKEWASRPSSRGRYEFIDYFSVPGVRELYNRNLQIGKSLQELIEDHKLNVSYLEELAQVLFIIALEDTSPDLIRQLPSPIWLNAWGISLDQDRWPTDKLFSPASEPRDLKPLLDHMRKNFGLIPEKRVRPKKQSAVRKSDSDANLKARKTSASTKS